MRKVSLLIMVCVFAGFNSALIAQNNASELKVDRWLPYQHAPGSYQFQTSEYDQQMKAFAERLQLKFDNLTAVKSKASGPVIGTNLKNFFPANTGSNGLSERFVRFVYEDSQGNTYFSGYGVDIWDGFQWENINVNNSPLPSNTVLDMLETQNGDLWFATTFGILVWDLQSETGYVLDETNSDLINNRINNLHQDKAGNIYVGHQYIDGPGGGVTVYNSNGSFKRIINGAEGGIYGEFINDMIDHDGNLYIATSPDPENGLYGGINMWSISGDTMTAVYNMDNSALPYNEVRTLEVDANGHLWAGLVTNPNIGHNEGGLIEFDGTNWAHYSQDKGFNVPVNIQDLKFDSNGTLWMGGSGVYTFEDDTFSQIEDNSDDGFALTSILRITEMGDQSIAFAKGTIGLEGGGASFWDAENGSWEHINTRDGGVVGRVFFGADYDSQGNLWATGFYGLQRYDGESWELWTEKDGLSDTYGWDLIVDQNDNVWVNGAGHVGLTKINADGSMEVLEVGSFVESNWEASDGSLWFGDFYDDYDGDGTQESNGVLHIDGTNQTVYDSTDGLPAGTDGAVISIAEDQSGRILAATYDGLYRLEGGSFSKWEFPGYEGGSVFKLHLDSQNRLWISGGLGANSLAMFDGSNWEYFDQLDGVNGWIEDIEEDAAGRIWFAQHDGTIMYDNGMFHRISPKDGVPSNTSGVYDLAPSKTDASILALAHYQAGITIIDSELPVAITSLTDNPNDQGGWIRMQVDGYLFSANYAGESAEAWRPEINMDGTWESAAPTSPAGTKSVSVQVPVTKPTGETPDESNSYDFRVVALNGDGDVVGISETMIGYAEDNIAPAKVQNFNVEKTNENNISMSWTAVTDNDLDGYAIYESSVTDFAGTEPIAFTRVTDAEVDDNGYSELVVVAVDYHNNYGTASESMTVTSNEKIAEIPDEFALKQNYPNPFNPTTQITFDLPQNSHARITVFNALGQKVAVLLDEAKSAGTHEITFNAQQMNSGMYFYRIEAGSFTQTRKMMLIK